MNRPLSEVDRPVFWGSTILISAFVIWGLIAPKGLGAIMSTSLGWVIGNFGWTFILMAAGALLLCVFFVVHPWGSTRLGPDDSRPEFRTFSWVAMMFAAGLGQGLLFYGIAEPVSHWTNPPHGLAEPGSEDAALLALRYTYFHWGFNGWAMYAVMGGAMAYFSFRKGLPVLVSSTFAPILGRRAAEKPLGRLVDGLAIVATLFGTATALGLNGLQLNSGLNYLFDIPRSNAIAVTIILAVTALFVISATSGVEKGINFLANMGALATIALFLFFLAVGGATVLVISQGIESIGTYILQVLPMSLQTGVGDEQWMAGWTIFYWAWWLSWAPFVGMFVARISRGRTIREFVLGVVAAPTGFGFIWFAVVGGTGIELERSGRADIASSLATPELSLFAALDALPLPVISSAVCVVLIALFFISGADAASVVMATMASRGTIRPSRVVIVVLGTLMGGIACAMLLVGGLVALQQAAVLGSVPFMFVLLGSAYCWVRALREEKREERRRRTKRTREGLVEELVVRFHQEHDPGPDGHAPSSHGRHSQAMTPHARPSDAVHLLCNLRHPQGVFLMTRFQADRHVLPEPDQAQVVSTALGVDDQVAAFDPVRPTAPPQGAPNVVVVVMDDLGFGSSSAFGGPCIMPTADALADRGLRFNRFHVTALCSPTRQALMTGRNHHSVGMGGTTEMATSAPGYNGFRPRSAATMAQILQGNGYSTAAFGKWHQTPAREISPVGPFDRWPTGEGFDTFYGFMGAEMNHWYPLLFEGTTPVEPSRRPEDGYHLSEDLADRAIEWVRTQRTLTPDRPFFTYLALGASHAPLHVAHEWQEKYRGAFDDGWDALRERTLAEQKRLGVVPEDAELAPWAHNVPHWNEMSETQRTLCARFMETFAAFTEHADHQVGRFVAALEDLGEMENTIFIYLLGDNGASGEGGIEGTTVEHRLGHGIVDDPAAMLADIDLIGGPESYPIAPVGWAIAMNTPFQWTKQVASHFGGTRDGLIVHWPKGIAERGGIRSQFHHVIDILPTILECVGIPQPTSVAGVTQKPIEGTSMRYAFNAADERDRRRTQYFEMCGNRGIYHEGWMAVTRHGIPWEMIPEGGRRFRDDVWELYDIDNDFSQAHDLSAERPELLRELQDLFLIEAAKYQVFPLDPRVTERENPTLAGRIDLLGDRRSVTYRGGMRRFTEETTPNVKNRSHSIVADIEVPEDGADGVIVAQGGRFGGWTLYCVDGQVRYDYNYFDLDHYNVAATTPLTPGRHEVRMEFAYDGGGHGLGGDVVLVVDGAKAAEGRVDQTIPYYFSFDETLDVGVDLSTPVTDDYAAVDNAFTGTIHTVRIDLGDETPATDDDDAKRLQRVHVSH